MARPTLALGTAGRVRTYRTAAGWKARVLFRDYDGATRPIERRAASDSAARRALAEALRDRGRHAGYGLVTPDSRFSDLVDAWWDEIQASNLSPSTVQQYRDRLDRQILPALANVRIRELSVGLVDRHLAVVKAKHGASLAKTTKSVLSGVCRLGCRLDVLESNPCRDVATISTTARRRPRSLSASEVQQLRAFLTYDRVAIKRDLPDLVAFLCATGARLGEACAVTWDSVDLDAGTVEIKSTVLRIKSMGLVVKPTTKTKAGGRILELPTWCVETLRRRQGNARSLFVLPTELGNLRDPSNTRRALQEAYVRIGYGEERLNTHIFRKTVASLIDAAGLPSRVVADQLGHAKVTTTMDVYIGRKVKAVGAGVVLEQLAGG